MLLRSLLVAAAFVALAAAPASAAPMLQPLKACYVAAQEQQREFVIVDGSGFTPTANVDFYVDEIRQDVRTEEGKEVKTTFDGKLLGSVPAPFVDAGERLFTLRVTERDNPLNSVTATSRVTRLMVEQTPAKAATRDRVRFRGRGFTNLALPVYAHYIFAGKSQKTVRLGLPTGECGRFSVKRRQFPFKKSPRRGVWTIQFDQEKIYNPKATVRFPLNVRVSRAIKPEQAQAR
jgi:hypothetical protein